MSNEELDGGRVPVTETRENTRPFTVYKICVTSGSRQWFIFRRYNEFYRLFEILRRDFPNVSLKLPGKRMFGNLKPEVIENRRIGLDLFVQQLFSEPRILHHPDVRSFLSVKSICEDVSDSETDLHSSETESPNISPSGTLHENGHDTSEESIIQLGVSERPSCRPTDFEFLKVVGKGSFGKVFLAKHRCEGKIYAVKVLQKAQIKKRNEVRHIMSERNVLVDAVDHSFLVKLHYSFQTRDKLYFVLDYVNGGELFFHLQRERTFSESRARFYAAEIACALGYLHSKDIIYRDLKPENLLLDAQGHIILTDFGLCKEGIEGKNTTNTFCGTPEYLAPEVILKQSYDKTVDWWCLGCVLYEMLFGLPPFYSRDHKEMYDNILCKPLRLRNSVSTSAQGILRSLLEKDRHKRLGAKFDFDEVREHLFFVTIDWLDLQEKRISPPYNPNVNGSLDLKNIDPEFTKEPVPESVGLGSTRLSASVQEADNVFFGFSYVPPIFIEEESSG